jgi:ABC-type Fe3+-hydroxamate transport system substrate-binding protein
MSRTVKDQMGEFIVVPDFPKRIVSLVPSQTELLFDLGLGDRVVGITKFCVHPVDWFKTKTRVGGTKSVNIEKVKALSPDLIIGNKEENTREDIDSLRNLAPVWMSDIETLDDALWMINSIGELTHTEELADVIASKIKRSFDGFVSSVAGKSVLYLIWKNPYMGAASTTFIDDLLTQTLGLENVLAHQERYPELDLKELTTLPELIFLSSEPFPFKEKHIKELEDLFPKAQVLLVDGEYFSWYGSRLMGTVEYFQRRLNL